MPFLNATRPYEEIDMISRNTNRLNKSPVCFVPLNESQVLEDKTILLRLPEPFKIVKCKRCGLIYMNPRDLSTETYDESYYVGWNYIHYEEGRSHAYYTDKYYRLEKVVPSKGTVLDLGCGGGHFLMVGKQSSIRTLDDLLKSKRELRSASIDPTVGASVNAALNCRSPGPKS
jgi:2-polyprenyl-3-methyl-5-hydroxy-6-metoxy-1,4-benzoquinol methylase